MELLSVIYWTFLLVHSLDVRNATFSLELKGFELDPQELTETQRERCQKYGLGEGNKVAPLEYQAVKVDEEKATLRDLQVEVGDGGSQDKTEGFSDKKIEEEKILEGGSTPGHGERDGAW